MIKFIVQDILEEGICIKRKKEFVDFRWKEYKPRYYRSISEVPDTLSIDKNYDKNDYISFVRKPKNPIYLSEKATEDPKAMKMWVRLRRSSGIFLILVIVFAVVILTVNYYKTKQQAEILQATTEEQSSDGTVNLGSDEAVTYDKETGLAVYSNDFNLKVISPSEPADETFTVSTTNIGGVEVDSRISDALSLMLSDASEDNVSFNLVSGYISYEDQQKLFDDEVARLEKAGTSHLMSEFTAGLNVSKPGESDAQTGLSIVVSEKKDTFTKTSQYNWLTNNAANYGFIFRYPENDSDYTGHEADLTVLRYVGRDNAIKMRQLDMCLEEYINYIYDK